MFQEKLSKQGDAGCGTLSSRSLKYRIRCLSLKCRPQHDGRRWQPLIPQVPTCKSNAIPPLHCGLQLSKITKKNNHIPYNMRCWICCPPSSSHFLRKCAFTRITSYSEIESILRLILAFNSSNVWSSQQTFYSFQVPPQINIANPRRRAAVVLLSISRLATVAIASRRTAGET